MIFQNFLIKIKVLLSSFTVKLFVWFWLIAIVSIFSTRFISQQLSHEYHSKVITQSSTDEELELLYRTAARIKRSQVNNIEQLLTRKHKKLARKPHNVWLKRTDNYSKAISLNPMPPRFHKILSSYLNEKSFTQSQTSIFSHSKIIGPIEIEINQKTYQLFISKKMHKQDISQMVQSVPYWLRIIILGLISFALCLLLAHTFSKPVRLIRKATNKLGQGNFETRVTGLNKQNGELGQLASSFNKMAEQLQQNQSAQQRLLGDVSHELRSPMTRLQMALGLAQQESTTQQSREQYLIRCQREVERLDSMIEDVLALSRLENTLQIANSEQVNLTALIQSIVNDEQFLADKKAIIIESDLQKDLIICGDQILLTSAISNVINNAVKYSPDQSTIEVKLSSNEKEIKIMVSDAGEGVPEQSLTQLFTPFYRVHLARDRNTGGTGLGLAIAKQAVAAHQGKIFALNNSSIGLSVIIQLPYL